MLLSNGPRGMQHSPESWTYWKTDLFDSALSRKYWNTDFLEFLISWKYWKSDFSNFSYPGNIGSYDPTQSYPGNSGSCDPYSVLSRK